MSDFFIGLGSSEEDLLVGFEQLFLQGRHASSSYRCLNAYDPRRGICSSLILRVCWLSNSMHQNTLFLTAGDKYYKFE